MGKIILKRLACIVAFLLLLSCFPPSENSPSNTTSTPATTPTPTITTTPTTTPAPTYVVAFSWTGIASNWPNIDAYITPRSTSAITDASVVYAVNNIYLTGTNTSGQSILVDNAWSSDLTAASAENTWYTGTKSGLSASTNIGIRFWNSEVGENIVYIKSINLTYADASTETITFTSSTTTINSSVDGDVAIGTRMSYSETNTGGNITLSTNIVGVTF